MIFSLCNINTWTDTKTTVLNNLLEKVHLQFFTEINSQNIQNTHIITSDINYTWLIIPKEAAYAQRIGIRYKSNIGDKIKLELLDHTYLAQERTQIDKCAVQMLLIRAHLYHITLKFLLIYRVPDTRSKIRDQRCIIIFKKRILKLSWAI